MQQITTREQVSALSSKLTQTLVAGLLGLVILLLVGFAPLDTIHSAAHDSRHSVSFPCH